VGYADTGGDGCSADNKSLLRRVPLMELVVNAED
jgi:hypothetical protein